MEYQSNRGKICKKDGCNNKAKAKGLCMSCYNLNKYHLNNRNKLRKE